jgi:CheY-like chemotaxis protein
VIQEYEKTVPKLISFLLVEDDEDHAQLVMRSLVNHRVTNRIDHVKDGAQALDFLHGVGQFQNRLLPDIVLLDLKLPKIDGHEVLKRIKEDPILKVIPVVILTTSAAESDRISAYENYANSYLVKPLEFSSFYKMVDDLKLYWGVWNYPPSLGKELGKE